MRRNQAEFERVARQIDPQRTPEQILQSLENDHPTAGKLLDTFRGALGGLRDYVEKHGIVTIPSTAPPTVEETPPFMRALTTASMDTPGPFEKVAKEAFFNVTLPEPSWPAQEAEEYLQGFNRGTIVSTAVHEVYPGHYVQFLWVQQAPTKVRKLIGCGSNSEGWAHYSEQMMLDEGYGGGDPMLRLGQLQDALLRDARFIVGIRMHTGQMTPEEAVEFFVKEGRQVRPVAEKEAKRGTSDPTYLVYTLGKLEILKLREDYKTAEGAAIHVAWVPRRVPAPGLSAHQDRAPRPAGERFAGVVSRVRRLLRFNPHDERQLREGFQIQDCDLAGHLRAIPMRDGEAGFPELRERIRRRVRERDMHASPSAGDEAALFGGGGSAATHALDEDYERGGKLTGAGRTRDHGLRPHHGRHGDHTALLVGNRRAGVLAGCRLHGPGRRGNRNFLGESAKRQGYPPQIDGRAGSDAEVVGLGGLEAGGLGGEVVSARLQAIEYEDALRPGNRVMHGAGGEVPGFDLRSRYGGIAGIDDGSSQRT